MPIFLTGYNALFYHLPRTGGSWVSEALRALKVPRAGPPGFKPVANKQSKAPTTYHATYRSYPAPEGFLTFAFVRHPLTWYPSYWAHARTQGPPDAFQRCGSRQQLKQEDFAAFLTRCLKTAPPPYTQICRDYLGDDFKALGFVGRQELLVHDFCRLLDRVGVPKRGREAKLATLQPVKRSLVLPKWPKNDYDEQIRAHERAVIDYFYAH